MREAREIFGMSQPPCLNVMNFAEQGKVWTTFRTLKDIANLRTVAEMSNIETVTQPDIL